MTECFEIAENLPPLPRGATLDDARRVVRELIPDATETIIDNVAQAYWEIWACNRSWNATADNGVIAG